jgi:hypothetical protein
MPSSFPDAFTTVLCVRHSGRPQRSWRGCRVRQTAHAGLLLDGRLTARKCLSELDFRGSKPHNRTCAFDGVEALAKTPPTCQFRARWLGCHGGFAGVAGCGNAGRESAWRCNQAEPAARHFGGSCLSRTSVRVPCSSSSSGLQGASRRLHPAAVALVIGMRRRSERESLPARVARTDRPVRSFLRQTQPRTHDVIHLPANDRAAALSRNS